MQLTAKLGIAPIAWSNDDLPRPDGDLPLEACLAESRMAGFSGVEAGGRLPTSAARLAPLLKKHRLELASGRYAGSLLDGDLTTEKARALPQLALCRELGAACLVYTEAAGTARHMPDTPPSNRRAIDDVAMRTYGRRLTAFAEFCAGQGVPLAFRSHAGTVIENEDDIDRLMAATGGAVHLLVDTGHLAVAGVDLPAVLERHGRRVVHVHAKDIRPSARGRPTRPRAALTGAAASKAVYTVPGDGCIDFSKIVGRLADIGYQGWFVVEAEQDPAKAPPLACARIGHSALSAHLIQAGYRVRNGSRAVVRSGAMLSARGV